ncbi:hypothetical protein BYT27DRAFT_7219855 [Phlegmacium glaucopus]|nr:hypothetical protein BYT27DRAFT_7219855 [Phlegmacium glaucopus]
MPHVMPENAEDTHDERVAAWNLQVQEDTRALDEARNIAEEQEREVQALKKKEIENEQREIGSKKPKMNDFNAEQAIDDFILPQPAAYALWCLDDFDFIELWYFSQEGCTDASMNQRTQLDDTFGLTKFDEMLSLRPVSSLKASRNVTTLIQHLANHWPAKHITALAHFFMNLETHTYRHRPFGEWSLLIYQARARCNWHDQPKQNNAFNIAIINKNLLQTIHREVLDVEQTNSIKEVSVLFSFGPFKNPN